MAFGLHHCTTGIMTLCTISKHKTVLVSCILSLLIQNNMNSDLCRISLFTEINKISHNGNFRYRSLISLAPIIYDNKSSTDPQSQSVLPAGIVTLLNSANNTVLLEIWRSPWKVRYFDVSISRGTRWSQSRGWGR